jgi:ribosomal protein S18 acetylase RimI-like enzyme
MGGVRITFMEKSDLQESAKVLSIAMLSNPLHVAVFQGKEESQRMHIETMFTGLLTELPEIVLVAKKKENIIGVMRMKSCDGNKVVATPDGPHDETNIDWRKFTWLSEWARHEPPNQHWHLGPIGVLPSHQGTGVGTMLMDRFCMEVDACAAEAYLETDLDKNVRFYGKFGFKLVEETVIFGVKNRYMIRPASA